MSKKFIIGFVFEIDGVAFIDESDDIKTKEEAAAYLEDYLQCDLNLGSGDEVGHEIKNFKIGSTTIEEEEDSTVNGG